MTTEHKKAKYKKAKLQQAKRNKVSNAHKKKREPKPALSAREIFANVKRPAITEAIRAKGENFNEADIDRQIAALWDAETNSEEYFTLAREDWERYADEKAAFDWGGGAVARATKRRTATPNKRAASYEDAALTPPAPDVVSFQRASVSAAAASVYSYAVGYLEPSLVRVELSWIDPPMARHQRTRWAALQLLAAGCGLLRVPTCSHTLRVTRGMTFLGEAVLRRALLLLGPGELQELRDLRVPKMAQPPGGGICNFIRALLWQEAIVNHLNGHSSVPCDAPVAAALASLRVIKGSNVLRYSDILIRLCAATLTELDCSELSDDAHRVLPHFTRLESLTWREWPRSACPPAAWLGLSQLHTLRGVSLYDVPLAAMAAALPRLHTLHIDHGPMRVEFPVAAFYEELLPRLRSFRLFGGWTSDGTEVAGVSPLPLLEDLQWRSHSSHLPRQFMGARPSMLYISDADLVEWLKVADAASADSPAVTSPLACVRGLTHKLGRTPPDAASTAKLLRTAPHLRKWTLDMFACDPTHGWPLSEQFTSAPEFAGLVHPKLRHVVATFMFEQVVPAKCGVRLRQRHFPRLRRLTVDEEEYPM